MSAKMSTELKIKIPTKTNARAYIEFYHQGKRVREYTGNSIQMDIEPNKQKDPNTKLELLYQLKHALSRHINENNYPVTTKSKAIEKVVYSLDDALKSALEAKLRMKLSRQYKENLILIYHQFIDFTIDEERSAPFESLVLQRLEDFLNKFNSSGTYYMKKRNDLCILFSCASKLAGTKSIARETHTERSKAKLHKAYEKKQLVPLFEYLHSKNKQLHLCCLLTYGCWLRPHVEVLSLTKSNFKNGNKEIHLSGSENKGGRVRVVYVPEYVQIHLHELLCSIGDKANIFSRCESALNRHFFITTWKRARKHMLEKGMIEDGQTIYSFRHTAAIEVYKKTKDIYLLQKLMGHGSIGVTQKYLRNLGVVDIEELKNSAPTL
jgi:integrase